MEKYSKSATDNRKIYLYQGSIVDLELDAIVNAANPTLTGGGGVDGAIHVAAGKELYEECLTLGGCNFGEAKITKGYNLKSSYIIHTVGPIYTPRFDQSLVLKSCYLKSLELARENDIHSIAFPAVSCGVYGYPLKEALTIAINAIFEFKSKHRDYQLITIFIAYESSVSEAMQTIYDEIENKWLKILDMTDYEEVIKSLIRKRDSTVLNIEGKIVRKMISGDSMQEKMAAIFSPDKYKRDRLVKTGNIVWARLLEAKMNNLNRNSRFIARMIFSPESCFITDPSLYEEIVDRINCFIEEVSSRSNSFKERRLLCALTDDGEEPRYFQLPEEISGKHIIYLNTHILNPDKTFNPINLIKYIPIFMNKNLSKEVIVVPQSLYSEEYIKLLELNSSN